MAYIGAGITRFNTADDLTVTDDAEIGGDLTVTGSADINGGTIDGVTIGGASAGAGTFTTVTGSGDMNIDSGTLFVDASENRVGIGTTSPVSKLSVKTADILSGSTDFATVGLSSVSTFSAFDKIATMVGGYDGTIFGAAIGFSYTNPGYDMVFATNDDLTGNPIERMRIDSSGNLLVGKTDLSLGTTGHLFGNTGYAFHTRNNAEVLYLNRNTSDGNIILLAKDSATVGSIAAQSGDVVIYSTASGHAGIRCGQGYIASVNNNGTIVDNTFDLGLINFRWDDVYATNGTIQTSDRNEKQDIASLTTAEMAVAARLANQFKTFRWIDSVTEKGDNARTHAGIIAQDVQQAFTDEGLDAGDYAMFISTTWWETQTDVPAVEAVDAQDAVYDEEGNLVSEAVEAVEAKDAYTRTDTYDTADEAPEGATERTRMGIRYPELLSFMQAYNDQRMTSIEARLDALEAN